MAKAGSHRTRSTLLAQRRRFEAEQRRLAREHRQLKAEQRRLKKALYRRLEAEDGESGGASPSHTETVPTNPGIALTASQTTKRRSKTQLMLLDIAADLYPGGCDYVEMRDLIKVIGDELTKRRIRVPNRDVFLRAFDRRKD